MLRGKPLVVDHATAGGAYGAGRESLIRCCRAPEGQRQRAAGIQAVSVATQDLSILMNQQLVESFNLLARYAGRLLLGSALLQKTG